MSAVTLIMNACVAFTGFYLISKIHHSHLFVSSRIRNVLTGTFAGLLGLFLMLNAVEVNEDVRIDLRHLPAVLLVFHGTYLPLFIATTIIASTRFLFGISDQAIIAFIGTFVVSFGMVWIHRRLGNMLVQGMVLNVWALSMLSFGVFLNLGWGTEFLYLTLTLWTVGLLVGLLTSALTIDLEHTTRRAKEFQRSAERDHLTGLYNRRVWDHRTQQIEVANRNYNVLALDIDHFKQVNDRYGHANGDLVLKRFADLMMIETRAHDLVARIGGEEFVILMYDLTPAKVNKVAERIRSRIENEQFQLNDFPPIHVTVSIGISHGKMSIRQMTEMADTALYEAKRNGRNQVILHARTH